jgi:EF hand
MNPKLRQQRSVFLLFLGACFVALMAALPIVTAQTGQAQKKEKEAMQKPSAATGATAPSSADEPDFERTDRNKDGFVDKSEAGVIPGLSANFERADRSRDGKLDREEFAKGLQILQVRR